MSPEVRVEDNAGRDVAVLIKFKVPEPEIMPPRVVLPVLLLLRVRLLPANATVPLNVAAMVVPVLPIVSVPTEPVPKVMLLGTLMAVVPMRRLAEPPAESPSVTALPEAPSALADWAITVPFLMRNPPVKVEAVLDPPIVIVPSVVLSAPAAPAIGALSVPFRRSKAAVLVNMPVVPVMLPFLRLTEATVSVNVTAPKVPPLMTSDEALFRALAKPKFKVPLLTVVVPV